MDRGRRMVVVIFYSQRRLGATDYDDWAARMSARVQGQPGFSHSHSFRNPDGFGVTLSYWESDADIARWGRDGEHHKAQAFGRSQGYLSYRVEVAEVKSVRGFEVDGVPTSLGPD